MSGEYMLNEHERDQDPEEGEYHFSDEGAYESNTEEEPKAPLVTEKSGLTEKLSSYKRFVMLGGLFAGVVFVVYLVMAPPTTTQPTEITEAAQPTALPHTEPVVEAAYLEKPAAPLASKPSEKIATPTKVEGSMFKKVLATVTGSADRNKAMTAPPAATPVPTQTLTTTVPKAPPAAIATPAEQTASAYTVAAPNFSIPTPLAPPGGAELPAPAVTSLPTAPPQPVAQAPANQAMLERLTALEESNAKLISQLNAEYARKMADFETQDRAREEQLRSLTNKISGMEAQMGQLIQTLNRQATPPPASASVNTSSEELRERLILPSSTAGVSAAPSPKSNYSVQAIIPGRAWLRTDSGDTVTVAEGDVLKGLGRVTKIDPYDGTIQIDTGSKLILLTYGNGDYA